LTHWACCKIESTIPDDDLVAIIKKKLSIHRDINFTKIAHKAFDIGKRDLVLKLLELESDIKKKVLILLWLNNYEKAI